MLIRKGFLIAALCLVTILPAMSQATTGQSIDDHLLIKESDKGLGVNRSGEVDGTPYLNDTFANGEVYFDKNKRTVVQARYNMYDDLVEYQQNNQTLVLDPDERIKKVKIDEHTFIVDKYLYKGKIKHGYFTLLDSGKVTLLSKKVCTFKEQQAAKALESRATPAKYVRARKEEELLKLVQYYNTL